MRSLIFLVALLFSNCLEAQSIFSPSVVVPSGGQTVLSITGTGTNVTSTNTFVSIDSTSGNAFVYIPTAVGNAGRSIEFQKISTDTNSVTIDPSSTQTINGASLAYLFGQWDYLKITSNGTNWYSANYERVLSAALNCDASSAITSQSGNWIASVGNISSGACGVTIKTNVFSASPTCSISDFGSGRLPRITASGLSATAFTIGFRNSNDNTDATSGDAMILCRGLR